MPPPTSDGRLRSLLITFLVACLTLVAWQLADVLLLGFGGVLVATILSLVLTPFLYAAFEQLRGSFSEKPRTGMVVDGSASEQRSNH